MRVWERLFFFAFALIPFWAESQPGSAVARCELTDAVDSGSAGYLEDCVHRAEREGFAALLVRMDTPGGSLESTRQIVSAFLGSTIPILVWVGPSGARAGSAGVFVVLASDLAAMAPGTNIGAAHPIEALTGANPGAGGNEEMARKIENDAAAFAQSIAKQRGRNGQWAEEAVRKSVSIPADRAMELKVINFVAHSEEEFLAQAAHAYPRLTEARLTTLRPTWGQWVVHGLANPSLAYLLFVAGALGLLFEFSHPGAIAPGFFGLVCFVLGLLALSALPIRMGAVVILLLGVALIAAEIWAAHGALAVAGVALLVLGAVLLMDRHDRRWFVEPSFAVDLSVVLPTAILLGGAAAFVAFRAAQARRLPQRGGDAGLVGEMGQTLTEVGPTGGEVFVHGERWNAVAGNSIPAASRVRVEEVKGLTVVVRAV